MAMTTLRVAAVQASYVLMDRAASIDRVAALTAAAAAQAADLVVFPELFVPGTPIWIDTRPMGRRRGLVRRVYDGSWAEWGRPARHPRRAPMISPPGTREPACPGASRAIRDGQPIRVGQHPAAGRPHRRPPGRRRNGQSGPDHPARIGAR
jgi:hypothetical protein